MKASPPPRRSPKTKGRKTAATNRRQARKTATVRSYSESGSESDKDSASGTERDKDSEQDRDSTGGGAGSAGGATAPSKKSTHGSGTASGDSGAKGRKRGRRPKSKNGEDEGGRSKRAREPFFKKPPVPVLKRTGESFLQDGACFEVAPRLAKCRECRWTPHQRSKNMPNIFCRFYAFRKLRYTKSGQLAIAGFSNPYEDCSEDDLRLWVAQPENPPGGFDVEMSRFLLTQIGDQFCDLLLQEAEAQSMHVGDGKIAWKRVVQGVREMCDVCETTLFNYHWACAKCGFVVCLDCYKCTVPVDPELMSETGSDKERDFRGWLFCTNRQAHEQSKLMLTQIIAADTMMKLAKRVHQVRALFGIAQNCGCPYSFVKPTNGLNKDLLRVLTESKPVNGVVKTEQNGCKADENKNSPLNWLADLALQGNDKSEKDVISNLVAVKEEGDKENGAGPSGLNELRYFVRRYKEGLIRNDLPLRIMTLTDSQAFYPDVKHIWLCDGKLLRLTDPLNPSNYRIFQDQWKRGQPVIVSEVSKMLDMNLWHPDSFNHDFGDERNDLINCLNGSVVPNQPMKKFWEGFEHTSKRLKDEKGNSMLLKIKDWPAGEDFAEHMPSRFSDLMGVLPLSEYTHRTGRLNLATRLPECFVRPDLGPKMYTAYGSAAYANKGTTNLHLDISDAVNVMVYVGIPKDSDSDDYIKEAYRAIDEAGCDILTRRRVRERGELPGALWHIYHARDADKIRDLLNKVAQEKGQVLPPHHDPIYDQSWYLDGPLRERLYKEYQVEGYAIVQCQGDAVFIPAGAPHQVRNLHNCIKVAEDFVSPENVYHCFHLTQELRMLSSDTNTNHEDKLQIKNILYHAVKDSLSVLSNVAGLISEPEGYDLPFYIPPVKQEKEKDKQEEKEDKENDKDKENKDEDRNHKDDTTTNGDIAIKKEPEP